MICRKMPAETATIRVSRETRDRLAAQARERGVSVASMLSEVAREAERQSMLRSEREASRLDASSPAALAEMRDWEAAAGDGIE
jgi:hypothetical protein